ncbi:YhcN/YlaJ family sporulation lipoprotein [Neobacillus sp. FSL H8-0543]|uniref:YhcN/YlaJ family sporulation lipoprotein n=1 Tax=Neobacillus sp. FSL H8-0543 TaxID=2954672 RepID=UPI00315830DD
MKKKQWMIPLSAIIAVGLAGCANDDRASMNKDNKISGNPVGYYSNENHKESPNGYPTDNDGPLTEMMDHKVGIEDQENNRNRRNQLQERDENGNPPNPTKPLAKNDRGFFQRDNRFSTSDTNYHGHTNQRIGTTKTETDPEFQDNVTGKIKRRVAGIDNVQQVRSVVYGNSVTVSVELVNNKREDETVRAIRNAVKPYINGRTVQVITDDGAIGRDRNRNNDIQHEEHNK